ncbi:MAG: hypothetical protein WC236_14960 [Gallionellaceae bacterium]|jgi:hypothetical protein
MKELKYTTSELNKAIASFVIVLGAHLPENLVKSMSSSLTELSGQISAGGEPNVGTLTKDFAQALEQGHTAKKMHQH